MRVSGLWVCALGVALCLTAACFGDNSDGGSDGPGDLPDGVPVVLEISGPDMADAGESFDVSVKVKGKANEQVSVAIDATLGSFTVQSKVVITDEAGEGVFATRYTNNGTGGAETITANVSALSSSGKSLAKALTILEVERLGNATALSTTFVQTTEGVLAYPITLATARTVRKIGILHPPQESTGSSRVVVGLYATDSPTSVKVIAKTSATLAVGANELAIPPTELEAGTYWIVTVYEGATTYYRSGVGTNTITMRSKTQAFSEGLADTITALTTSSTFFDRNLYLVLRK